MNERVKQMFAVKILILLRVALTDITMYLVYIKSK